jgi:hypothetical protein
VQVLAGTAGDTYAVAGPDLCNLGGSGSSASIIVGYDGACEGRSVSLYAEHEHAGATSFVAFLPVSLTANSTVTDMSAFTTGVNDSVHMTNIDSGFSNVNAAGIVLGAQGDVSPQALLFAEASVSGGVANAPFIAPAAYNAIKILESGASTTLAVIPAAPASTIDIDASTLPPPITLATTGDYQTATWSAISGATINDFEVNYAGATATLFWSAFLEPTETTIAFPDLPAGVGPIELGADTMSTAQIHELAIPGVTYTQALEMFDPDVYPDRALAAPAAGYAVASAAQTRAAP